jgi:hypothetical protein
MGKPMLVGLAAAGVIFAVSVPVLMHHYVSDSILDSVVAVFGDDPVAAERAVTTLCRVGTIVPSQAGVQTAIALRTTVPQRLAAC